MNSAKLDQYFKKTRNTICGRNPITIVLSIIENYKKNHADKKISFDTVVYLIKLKQSLKLPFLMLLELIL